MFAVRVSDEGLFADILRDLTNSVLRHAGWSEKTIAGMVDEIRNGLRGAPAGPGWDLQFRSQAGELEIVVSRGGRRVFHQSRALP
jgi:hypothetical protein